MSSSSQPKRASDVAFRQVEDDMVIVSASRGSICTVNPVGAFVWEMADGTVSVDDIVSRVCATFDVDEPDARADVDRFLAELVELGVMTGVDDA